LQLDTQKILRIIGVYWLVFFAAMLPSALLAGYNNSPDMVVFSICFVVGVLVSLFLVFTNPFNGKSKLDVQGSYLVTLGVWLSTALIGAIPFIFGSLKLEVIDALFQSVSMITTTGANVIVDVESADKSLILWCCIMQWLGGKGIIIMALILIPAGQANHLSLIQSETIDEIEKVTPRLFNTILQIFYLYVFLTVVCAFLFNLEGMSLFEAVCHALTTLSTGGFSTWNQSIQYVTSPTIQMTFCFFMFLGAANFLSLLLIKKNGIRSFFREHQILGFLKIFLLAVFLVTVWRFLQSSENFDSIFVQSLFNVMSALSTTGFVTADYSNWGGLALMIFFFLPMIGGCTGSTSGGIKIYRLQILLASVLAQLKRVRWPSGVFTPRLYGKPIDDSVISTVTNFFFLYFLTMACLCLLAGLVDLDFLTTISGVVATLTNLGPGLGEVIGPNSTYFSIPSPGKIVFILSMLLGRLELIIFFVVVMPQFWKR